MALQIGGGSVGERLRNYFRLQGRLLFSLDQTVSPVAIANDLSRPPWRDRDSMCGMRVAVGAGGVGVFGAAYFYLPATAAGAVVLRRFSVANDTGGAMAAELVLDVHPAPGTIVDVNNFLDLENPTVLGFGPRNRVPLVAAQHTHTGSIGSSPGPFLQLDTNVTKFFEWPVVVLPGRYVAIRNQTANQAMNAAAWGEYFPDARP